MLRRRGGQLESLWDEVLPEEARRLPEHLAQIDRLLQDEALLSLIEAHWDREGGAWSLGEGAGPPDDRAADLGAADGAQASLRLGFGDADARGIGLLPAAPLLSDLVVRGGAGRVDGGWGRRWWPSSPGW